jgi:hypothetical protein
MNQQELSRIADEIARFVIEQGRVEGEDAEWWIASLSVEVMVEANERGYDNPTEISEEAVRLYKDKAPKSSG